MRERIAAVVMGLLVFTVGSPGAAHATTKQITPKLVLGDLDYPAAFTLDPSSRIWYGLRFSGEIHIWDPATKTDTLFFTVPDLQTTGTKGLLGLAIDPDYATNHYVYAYATRDDNGSLLNEILRLTDTDGTGSDMTVIFSSPTTALSYHEGGRILFGPDGKLYVMVGDTGVKANAQDLTNTAGKILRLNADGTIPSDDPFAAASPPEPIWSFGHRNSFGFDFDPRTGQLWQTENGPNCTDELNRIIEGANYAWGPTANCYSAGGQPYNTNKDGPTPRHFPQWWFTPPIAPTGMAFCDYCGLGPANNGKFFFGTYNDSGELWAVTLKPARHVIQSVALVLTHGMPILSMEAGPGKHLYFSDPTGIYTLTLA